MSEQSKCINISHDTIRNIAKKINKITDKKILINVIKIIKSINPDVAITENANGLLIKFNSLSPETYGLIDNYLKKSIPKQNYDSEQNNISEYIPYTTDDIDSENKYKYSTHERSIIKKRQYASQMSE